jgi:hypothetical protein
MYVMIIYYMIAPEVKKFTTKLLKFRFFEDQERAKRIK